jgi:hypothetical protein
VTFSQVFEERIAATFGAAGEAWLASLPDTLRAMAARWSLDLEPPFVDIAYNYVVPATRADAQATSAAAQVMRALHQAPEAHSSFPTVVDWARGLDRLRAAFDGGTGPFPARLVERAESDLRALLRSAGALGFDWARIWAWGIYQAVLAAWWSYEEGDQAWEMWLAAAELIAASAP